MKLQQWIKQNQLGLLFQQGSFGLEKESQRIDENGNIVTTPHPTVFGNRTYHPYIQTDFAESQLELITPPNGKLEDSLRWLSAIHEVVLRSLPEQEFIFPFSMPAGLPPESAIQEAQLDNVEDVKYREHLSQNYGKYKQMVSGIHYKFQLSPEFVNAVFSLQNEYTALKDFQNALYMKLANNFLRYQWILVYLLAATPMVEANYFSRNGVENSPLAEGQLVRSLRSSPYGYVNSPDVVVNHDSLESYVETLEEQVKAGRLIAEKEFYSSVRFRGEDTVAKFHEKGIKYIEFRLFDLNPFAPFGILEKDVRFIHLFLKTLVWIEEADRNNSQKIGYEYSERTALSHPLLQSEYLEEGLWILKQMKELAEELCLPESDKLLIEEKENELKDPSMTIAAQLIKRYQETDSVTVGMELAKQYKKEALKENYSLNAYANMELSTQAVIEDAIKIGLKVQVIDENDQFLRIEYKDKVEYVKNGNMTSKDSYISPLIMENKVVTKKILGEQGFRVPRGYEVSSLAEAVQVFNYVKNKPIVIKPKSTNFGLGISIFKHGTSSLDDYSNAIKFALKEDKDILIEEFIEGTEYRFFVIEGKTEAVLLRVPANVVGDGKHTIRELVEIKNSNPLRGDAKKTPLKKIELGEIEKLQLAEQGLNFDSILPENKVAYLRENSNISTGGDSVDKTDAVHESYKKLAVEITDAMMAKVCGVDLIIPDITEEINGENYGVIEANFNPMMMMHIYPHSGKSRRLSLNVLKMLFPERNIK